MDITIVVNDVDGVHARQTTWLLASAAMARGHRVSLCGVGELGWGDDRVRIRRHPLAPAETGDVALAACVAAPAETVSLEPGAVVLIRTNPGRDEDRASLHAAALALLRLARRQGVHVLNDPNVLLRLQSKLNTLDLPESVRVPGIVAANADDVRRFVAQAAGPCVLKPLVGTRGRGVHLVQSVGVPLLGTPLEEAIADLIDSGPMLAQVKVPGAEQGDTRVLFVDGEVLRVDGLAAAVRRVPSGGDFRSNIAVGAVPARAVWTPELERVVRVTGPWLRSVGVWLAGLDVIGGRIIEVNVFSTGGLFDGNRFEGVDFAAGIIGHLERRCAAG